TGYKVNAHEIAPGVVYPDHNVTDTAFSVRHEEIVDSFGFRFDTPDRSLVISGDTAPTQALADDSGGSDRLIPEAYSAASRQQFSPRSQACRRCHHTSAPELAAIANEVKPGLLVIYHRSNAGSHSMEPEDVLLHEIRQTYKGTVVMGHDLDIL